MDVNRQTPGRESNNLKPLNIWQQQPADQLSESESLKQKKQKRAGDAGDETQVTDVSVVPVVIYVLVSVVHTERLVDGGALVHEVYGAPGVGRYVTDGQQSAERDEERRCSGGQSDRLNCPSVNRTEENDVTFDLCGDTAAIYHNALLSIH